VTDIDRLVAEFISRVASLGVLVERAPTAASAAATVVALAREVGAVRPLASAELIAAAPDLAFRLEAEGLPIAVAGAPGETRDAPLGLSLARLAVAETGSILLAEGTLEDRGIGLLVATQVVVCPTSALVSSLDDAAPVLRALAARPGGGYATLVTGPSRTADIERVLTVGVQGPARLAVVFVDHLT
jgi:L-lactate dehydrogenase complex protein LldG